MRSLTSAPGSTAPGKEIAASGAPATVRAHQGWLRRSARRTLGFLPGGEGLSAEAREGESGTTAYPAPQTIRAKALGCLKIESGNEGGCNTLDVMPGLDPGIHDEVPHKKSYA